MPAEYSPDKAIHHHKSLAILQEGGQPYPVHVQIIPTDYCNQDCFFCAYRTSAYDANPLFKIIEADGTENRNPRRSIPWPKMQEIISDCSEMGVRAIQLTGGGEPTLYPHFKEMLDLILDKEIDFSLVTNGLLAGKPSFSRIKEAAWLRFSLDSGTADTYSKIRRVPKQEFNLVLKNIASIASAPKKPTIGVGFVVTRDNYQEVALATKIARDLGVDNIRISAMFQSEHDHYFDSILPQVKDQLGAAKLFETPTFKVFNNFDIRYQDLQQGRPDYDFCPYMHFTTYIGGDQHVYTCCVNAYNPRGDIGSLENQSFKQLWDSQAKQKFFGEFKAHGCPRCMFNDKNKAIHQILEPPKSHTNFV